MLYKKITSLSNPLVRKAVDAKLRRNGSGGKLFLTEGPHLVETAVAAAAPIREVFFTGGFRRTEEGQRLLERLSAAKSAPGAIIEVTDAVFSRISDTESPQGILAVVACKVAGVHELLVKKVPLIAACDGIQDPGNLGTIIRVSDAAGADAVVILPGTCDPFLPKTVRATAGSIFNVPIIFAGHADFLEYLSAKGISLFVTDVRAQKSLYDIDLRKPSALAFGNESRGMSDVLLKKATEAVRIPINGKAESLNVAIAASVCLYEALRQRIIVTTR